MKFDILISGNEMGFFGHTDYFKAWIVSILRIANDKLSRDEEFYLSDIFTSGDVPGVKIPKSFRRRGWSLPKDYYKDGLETPYIYWDVTYIETENDVYAAINFNDDGNILDMEVKNDDSDRNGRRDI